MQLKYDFNSRLIGIEILADTISCDEQTRINIFKDSPSTVGSLKQLAQKSKLLLTEIKPDLSFETFWKRYNNTLGSKTRTEPIWNRLSERNKNLAIGYIEKYKQTLGNTTQAYAATYLNGQYWIK